MTQLERVAQQEARARVELAKKKAGLAKVQTAKRALVSRARQKRRAEVGALAEAHGLCSLDNTTLAGLFRCLARISAAPNPVAVMDGLLCDGHGLDSHTPGMADAEASCGPSRAIGTAMR